MNIVILGNGYSINAVANWDNIIKKADIVVRIKQGGLKKIYSKELFNIEHHLILQRSYYLRKLSPTEINFIKRYYKVVFFKLSENEKQFIASNNIKEVIKATPYTRHTCSSLKTLTESIRDKKILTSDEYNFIKNIAKAYKLPNFNFSLGFLAILYYTRAYPDAKINLYGFDFNTNTGWFWDKTHTHSKHHDFSMEKDILFNKLLLRNVFVNDY